MDRNALNADELSKRPRPEARTQSQTTGRQPEHTRTLRDNSKRAPMEGDFNIQDELGEETTTFLAACTASTHTITSKMPPSIMFGKELSAL
jgi:hypothetical protein